MVCIAAGISVKIEIRVVCHIHDSRLVRFRFITDINGIVICQLHQDFASDISREAFFTVFCDISKFHFLGIRLHCIKHAILETLRATVQAMPVVIARQLIFNAVQRKFTLINTVCITADTSSKIGRLTDVILNRIKPQHYVTHLSVLIGNHYGNDTPTEVCNANFHIVLITQSKQISFLSVHFRLEFTLQQPGFCSLFSFWRTSRHQKGGNSPYT